MYYLSQSEILKLFYLKKKKTILSEVTYFKLFVHHPFVIEGHTEKQNIKDGRYLEIMHFNHALSLLAREIDGQGSKLLCLKSCS